MCGDGLMITLLGLSGIPTNPMVTAFVANIGGDTSLWMTWAVRLEESLFVNETCHCTHNKTLE